MHLNYGVSPQRTAYSRFAVKPLTGGVGASPEKHGKYSKMSMEHEIAAATNQDSDFILQREQAHLLENQLHQKHVSDLSVPVQR